jgi:hypothetical protein
MFEMNTRGLIALAIQFVIPLLVGLVTKQSWSPGLKAVLLLAFTAITQFLVAWSDSGDTFRWQTVAYSIGIGFVVSVAVHFGLWRPVGAADAVADSGVKDTIRPSRL